MNVLPAHPAPQSSVMKVSWRSLDVVWRFALAGAVLVAAGLAVLGSGTCSKIEETVQADCMEFKFLAGRSYVAQASKNVAPLQVQTPVPLATTHDISASAQSSASAAVTKRRQGDGTLEGGIVGALAGLLIMGGLGVTNGNRASEPQRVSPADKIAELSELLRQNEELRQRLETASRRSTEDAELQDRKSVV